MELHVSCPLGTTRLVPQEKFPESHVHVINPLLTKFVRSRWLDIGLLLFLHVYGPRLRLGQHPAILTSHLVNNLYILTYTDHKITSVLMIQFIALGANLQINSC